MVTRGGADPLVRARPPGRALLLQPLDLEHSLRRACERCPAVSGVPQLFALARDFNLAVLHYPGELQDGFVDLVTVLFAGHDLKRNRVAIHRTLENRRSAVIEVDCAGERRASLSELKAEIVHLVEAAAGRAAQPDSGEVRGWQRQRE